MDLIEAYGLLEKVIWSETRAATFAELSRFHSAEYLQAFQAAQDLGAVSAATRARYHLGTLENPYFDRFFDIPARATGGSIQAAEAVLAGFCAFNPAGGMHHARAGHAQGFCFFNDPVLGILRLLAVYDRVLYLDFDVHHGDGVELAFADEPRVLTLSLHMDSRRYYPFQGGQVTDSGRFGHHINFPLPKGTNDASYLWLLKQFLPEIFASFQPDAVVLQAGTDAHFADPLGRLSLTSQGFMAAVEEVLKHCPRHADATPKLLITGGGGYHPLVLARLWTALVARLSALDQPPAQAIPWRLPMPKIAQEKLQAVPWDNDAEEAYFPDFFKYLADDFLPENSAISDEIYQLGEQMQQHPFFKSKQRTCGYLPRGETHD
jgi:acetoin utilization protein AcuC